MTMISGIWEPVRREHINPYGHYTFNVQWELRRKGYGHFAALTQICKIDVFSAITTERSRLAKSQ